MSIICPICKKEAVGPFRKMFGQVASVYCNNCGACLHIPFKQALKVTIIGLLFLLIAQVFLGNLAISVTLTIIFVGFLTYREPFVAL